MTIFKTIYCDLDGVCANFHLEAARAHLRAGRRLPQLHHNGVPLELSFQQLYRYWPPGRSLQKYLIPEMNDDDGHWHPSMDVFWAPIRIDPLFWQKVPPFPWCHQLLKMLRGYCKDLVFVTTPDRTPLSYSGKYEWLLANKLYDIPVIMMHEKWRLADRSCLLIDDHAPNVQSWCKEVERRYEVPGAGILFPGMWNDNHAHALNPLPYVRCALQTLLSPQSLFA